MPSTTMGGVKVLLPLEQCRTPAASAETQCAAAVAVSPATATTARAGSKGPTAASVRQRTAAGLRSCAAPRFNGDAAGAAFADHHARMQKQQQFGRGTAGGMGRKQPVELAGLGADLLAMKRDARDIVAGPAFGAACDNHFAAFRLDKL